MPEGVGGRGLSGSVNKISFARAYSGPISFSRRVVHELRDLLSLRGYDKTHAMDSYKYDTYAFPILIGKKKQWNTLPGFNGKKNFAPPTRQGGLNKPKWKYKRSTDTP
ncbi:hypothetical protein EVAR_68598_1 [Eumeta japonica]|uniref:Uncharacterized protein n=1 Tax=Eumeta variegata TaxID=151549 RepID=A0A4C1ZLC1_EUMVA|nr:hypothetical protein EVAR_68598_1 [Eumeta japonica]